MSQLIPYEELKRLGNIPIDMGVLKSIYEHYQAPNMRIDLDDLRQLDPAIIKACAAVGKKRKVLENLLKLIAR